MAYAIASMELNIIDSVKHGMANAMKCAIELRQGESQYNGEGKEAEPVRGEHEAAFKKWC
eukprot:1161393-Pelagomonas_calceolata.AAC.2